MASAAATTTTTTDHCNAFRDAVRPPAFVTARAVRMLFVSALASRAEWRQVFAAAAGQHRLPHGLATRVDAWLKDDDGGAMSTAMWQEVTSYLGTCDTGQQLAKRTDALGELSRSLADAGAVKSEGAPPPAPLTDAELATFYVALYQSDWEKLVAHTAPTLRLQRRRALAGFVKQRPRADLASLSAVCACIT